MTILSTTHAPTTSSSRVRVRGDIMRAFSKEPPRYNALLLACAVTQMLLVLLHRVQVLISIILV